MWVRKVSDPPESLPEWPRVYKATAECAYFWRQSSSDTNDHLLLIMVHCHIERRFINLEKIHYCNNLVRHSCLITLLLREKEAEQRDRLCLMGKALLWMIWFLAVANIAVHVAAFLDRDRMGLSSVTKRLKFPSLYHYTWKHVNPIRKGLRSIPQIWRGLQILLTASWQDV